MDKNDNELAEQVRQRLCEADRQLIELLGFEVESLEPGRAVVNMLVRPDMANSGGACQGGLIFALADHAFAYACMSGNRAGVTLSANIIYSNPAMVGSRLTATAVVQNEGGRTGSCSVDVSDQNGILIAQFSGVHYKTKLEIVSQL
ncbi:MAG: hotdog fold thioesterase [Chloroflexota bacterium]